MRARADVPVTGLPRWSASAGLAALVVFLLIGSVPRLSSDPGIVAAGVVVMLAAGIPLFFAGPRWRLFYAAASTVGVALVNTDSRDVGWFAVIVICAWCVLVGGTRAGVFYWAACCVLLGGEWLRGDGDPGWGAWVAGVSFSVLAAIAVRHQLVLVDRLHAAQADLADHSRAEERNRIARELHDVIAHSLTVSLLHVSAARLSVEHDDRADALRALAEAERLGRQALTEVRAVVGVQPVSGIAAPVPGFDDLPHLVDQVRGAGLDVRLIATGIAAGLPVITGSTIYRIVQEALTNAAKHAPGGAVIVETVVGGGEVEVSIDSAGLPDDRTGAGMGIVNMRARAEAVGGTCTAAPGGHGWLVHARLPLTVDAPAADR